MASKIVITMTAPATSFSVCIDAYHDKIWRHVRREFREMRKFDGEETVHKARVAVKKLLALHDLIRYDDKALKPLLKIYKKLGKLRDHTNALSLCLEFKIDNSILECDRHKLKRICKEVKQEILVQEDNWKHIKKYSHEQLKKIDAAKWQKYLHKGVSNIGTAMSSTITRNQLHTTRKCIKNILYNNEIYSGLSSEGLDQDTLHRLKKLEGQISEWHDILMFKNNLFKIRFDVGNHIVYSAIKRKEQRPRKKITAHYV